MGLSLVSVPIGNIGDITLRALEFLKAADLVIGEERKPLFRLFKELGLEKPTSYELLNEHSKLGDLSELVGLCKENNVALVTDCGTPGFQDPGADLVAACRKKNIPVTSLPGPCSLSVFISLLGLRLDRFLFEGFLPRKTEERELRLQKLKKIKDPILLMDTPYRLEKTLSQINNIMGPEYHCVLGMDLTSESESVIQGSVSKVLSQVQGKKAEFMVLLFKP